MRSAISLATFSEIEFLLDDVEREVQHRVAERRDAERAPHSDQLRRGEEAARRVTASESMRKRTAQ